jgi:hypothetical protein
MKFHILAISSSLLLGAAIFSSAGFSSLSSFFFPFTFYVLLPPGRPTFNVQPSTFNL